jgi:hypothetical protein
LLTKGDSRCAPPDRIDIELYRSVAERDAFEHRVAAVQSHQAMKETQLPEEFRVLFRLPVVSRHSDRDRVRRPSGRDMFRLRLPGRRQREKSERERTDNCARH